MHHTNTSNYIVQHVYWITKYKSPKINDVNVSVYFFNIYREDIQEYITIIVVVCRNRDWEEEEKIECVKRNEKHIKMRREKKNVNLYRETLKFGIQKQNQYILYGGNQIILIFLSVAFTAAEQLFDVLHIINSIIYFIRIIVYAYLMKFIVYVNRFWSFYIILAETCILYVLAKPEMKNDFRF